MVHSYTDKMIILALFIASIGYGRQYSIIMAAHRKLGRTGGGKPKRPP